MKVIWYNGDNTPHIDNIMPAASKATRKPTASCAKKKNKRDVGCI